MKTSDRYSTCVSVDERLYVDDEGYRNHIVEHIQNELSKALISALYTKDAIVAIKGDSITQKDEYTCTINCRQDIYVKELVRCKDCKWIDLCKDPEHYEYKGANGFCSKGERKEVEE